ncbi:hypothetical protein [uncultured Desulfobacter sp.]|nr:hypothetical protein [uncultured Desulfobacter sp.]
MVEKGNRNRSKREDQKVGQLTLKEKRKKKKDKKLAGNNLQKITSAGTES